MRILSTSKNFSKTIEFPDNRVMIDLCGQLDLNLAKIEHEISVQILRRGNVFEISGDRDSCRLAEEVLQNLYSRLESGKLLEPGDIDAIINMPAEQFEPDSKINLNGQPQKKSPYQIFEITTRKKTILPRSITQRRYAKNMLNSDLTFGIGPAGTGKTYLAIAVAVSLYINNSVDKIILSRPAVEAGERLGFLPGDMKDKVDPYMQPLYEALQDCLPGRQISKMLDEKIIEIAPLAFMRGRTLSNAFVVLDEAQNTTQIQMKMFLTRLGENSKMVITGDTSQIDLPKGIESGLVSAIRILKDVKGINFSIFNSDDVVRHHMVTKIIKAYEAFDK